ncbi:MAG: hypothetical protein JW712_09845 [Dehalococcoidales bacterium]|nr:hypothetical protein [Dehalococcoidales bacterium]
MAGTYEHLLKPLKIAEMPGMGQAFRNTGNADVNRWLNGRDHMEGVKLNFSWGFYTGLGDWHPGMDPHVHPYPECLVFVGLDPARPNYLGADIQYCLGQELEIHRFNKPTVIIAPAGFSHCPSVTLDVNNPIGYSFFIISLGADPTSRWLGDGIPDMQMQPQQEPTPEGAPKPAMNSSFGAKRVHVTEDTISYGHRYDEYVKTLVPNTIAGHRLPKERKALYGEMAGGEWKPGPGMTENAVWVFGQDLLGMKVNWCWGIHTQPGLWMRGPGKGAHVHPFDEVLVFAGTEPSDIDYLGAEIQMDLGPEHERYIIDKPTAVVIPAGLPHNPIVTRWVDKPYDVLMMALDAAHDTKYVD